LNDNSLTTFNFLLEKNGSYCQPIYEACVLENASNLCLDGEEESNYEQKLYQDFKKLLDNSTEIDEQQVQFSQVRGLQKINFEQDLDDYDHIYTIVDGNDPGNDTCTIYIKNKTQAFKNPTKYFKELLNSENSKTLINKIASNIITSIEKTDPDLKPLFYQNIYLYGRCFQIPHLYEMVKLEIEEQMKIKQLALSQIIIRNSYSFDRDGYENGIWVGASLLGQIDESWLDTFAISLQEYEEFGDIIVDRKFI